MRVIISANARLAKRCHIVAVMVKLLYAVIVSVHDIDIVIAIKNDGIGKAKVSIVIAFLVGHAQRGQISQIRGKYLYAVVPRISNIDIAGAVESYALGFVEFVISCALSCAQRRRISTRAVKYLDAVVQRVGYIQVAVGVHANSSGIAKMVVIAPALIRHAHSLDIVAIRIKDLYPVRPSSFSHKDQVLGIVNGDFLWRIECGN